MTDTPVADSIEAARARLRLANPDGLSDDELERLAPQLAELTAGLARLAEAMELDEEPATIQHVVGPDVR